HPAHRESPHVPADHRDAWHLLVRGERPDVVADERAVRRARPGLSRERFLGGVSGRPRRQHRQHAAVDAHHGTPVRQRLTPVASGSGSRDRKSAITPPEIATDPVFLLDVDNTLLDNDAVTEDLRRHLRNAFGDECERRYWEIFEQLRQELGYADYLGALQRYRLERPRETELLRVSLFLLEYPFATRLYPGALDVIAQLKARGQVVLLSDGDVVFQPRKIERSGLWA